MLHAELPFAGIGRGACRHNRVCYRLRVQLPVPGRGQCHDGGGQQVRQWLISGSAVRLGHARVSLLHILMWQAVMAASPW